MLQSEDGSSQGVSPEAARVLMKWYDGNSYDTSPERVASALALFRWVRSVGALEYLPPDMRRARIQEGAERFGIPLEKVVDLVVSADELLYDSISVASTTKAIIAIEGIDGSGKTTQTKLLMGECESRGFSVAVESFPRYASFFGQEIRALLDGHGAVSASTVDPRSMALWYALDRWSAFRHRSSKADVLLLNRYSLSNAVYQAARSDGEDGDRVFSWVLGLEHRELGLPVADLTIVLDVTPEVSAARSRARSQNGERNEAPDVYERSRQLLSAARERYLRAAQEMHGVIVVEGTRPDGSERSTVEVQDEIRSAVEPWLG